MLLGTVGELDEGTTPWRAAHATDIEKQCVGCHMQKEGGEGEAHWEMSGHSFKVTSYGMCADCHDSADNAERFAAFLRKIVTDQMAGVKANLDRWATLKAPAQIQKYGTLAWEYDNAGIFSNPAGLSTIRGPRSDTDPAKDEQKYVPANIKKARYNLYLVLHDGSYGIHNGPQALRLLNAAQKWIQAELYE